MSKPRVLIADDHTMLAETLGVVLQDEVDVVKMVADGQELVTAALELRPDLIVTDIGLPSLNGLEAVARLRDLGVTAKVIFLTMHQDVAYARRAMEVGALGYVLKHSATAELVTAIREASRGQTYITPMIAGELLRWYRADTGKEGSQPRLTVRQREVLKLFAEGCSAKEVATTLRISVRTAEAHRARILEVLGLRSTAELVRYAIRTGIISL